MDLYDRALELFVVLRRLCIERGLYDAIQPESDRSDVLIFLQRDAMLAQYMLWPCIRPTVCPSITGRYCTKTAKHRTTQTTYNSTWTL